MAPLLFRLRQFFIVSAVFLSAYFLINTLNLNTFGQYSGGNRAERVELTKENNVKTIIKHSDRDRESSQTIKKPSTSENLRNQMCNIPKLDINGSEVIHFFQKHEPLECQLKTGNIEDNWVFVDLQGVIRKTERRKKAKCKLQYFDRVNDDENKYEAPIDLNDGDIMNGSDYAVVNCILGFSKWNSILWDVNHNEKLHEQKKQQSQASPSTKYDVYFIGIDSLSQMSYRRKLPKTVNFLEKSLGSVVLNGYNIVGDGTPQAFIPILTSQTEIELPLTRKRFKNANYVDDVYPFIWKNFSDAGYVTMYGEDAFNIGTFTYRLKGFRKQPTDHYTRTLFEAVEKLNDRNCIGSIPLHRMWFQNARKFMRVYKDIPRFLLMHQSLLSHDDINLVGVEDDDLAAHLKQMNDEGLFDNAIIVAMADHGHRFAKLRETHQGQLEERMPFFSIALPKSLKETETGQIMLKNLMDNKDKLTTPFDIHASLLDILKLPDVEGDFHEMQDAVTKRSLSVFRPIPEKRTCSQAGIEAHWCTCLSWENALLTAEDRKLSSRIASSVVNAINKETASERELCASLSLFKLVEAKKLLPEKSLLAYKTVNDADGFVPNLSGTTKAAFAHYQIKIQTTPGNAIYEATLYYDFVKDEMELDFASISHVNKYGDTPHCIINKNFYIATFCVCYDKV